MTKEHFYKNCLTKEGQEENEKEFNDLKTLKQYYKKDIDTSDISKWDEIIYIPKNGKIDIFDKETYEILFQHDWEIYTFFDILKIVYNANKSKSLQEIYEKAKEIYENFPSDEIYYIDNDDDILKNYIDNTV